MLLSLVELPRPSLLNDEDSRPRMSNGEEKLYRYFYVFEAVICIRNNAYLLAFVS